MTSSHYFFPNNPKKTISKNDVESFVSQEDHSSDDEDIEVSVTVIASESNSSNSFFSVELESASPNDKLIGRDLYGTYTVVSPIKMTKGKDAEVKTCCGVKKAECRLF